MCDWVVGYLVCYICPVCGELLLSAGISTNTAFPALLSSREP